MPRPLGVQLYSVRELLVADRDGVLGRLARIGYGAVEAFNPRDDPAGFRAIVDDLGLAVPSAHARALLGGEPERVLEAVATIGAGMAIVPGIPAEQFASRDGVARAADLLNGLAELAARHGLRLGYHNHWWEIEPRLDGVHAVEALAGLLAPEVFLQIDTYWAAVGGADVPALLRRLGDRVLSLHIKDGPVAKGEPQTAVGAGRMPVAEILAACPGAWRVVELDECATDMVAALADSHTYLTGLDQL